MIQYFNKHPNDMPTHAELRAYFGVSAASISMAISKLKDVGFLESRNIVRKINEDD
jgi:DNA-binding transcriptional regulator GbsR (MarR family)